MTGTHSSTSVKAVSKNWFCCEHCTSGLVSVIECSSETHHRQMSVSFPQNSNSIEHGLQALCLHFLGVSSVQQLWRWSQCPPHPRRIGRHRRGWGVDFGRMAIVHGSDNQQVESSLLMLFVTLSYKLFKIYIIALQHFPIHEWINYEVLESQ